MRANLPEKLAAERRAELLRAFLDMIDYAGGEGVSVILLAGDIFDSPKISATTAAAVRRAVRRHPEIIFAYLRGNHEGAGIRPAEDVIFGGDLPDNVLTFTDRWSSFRLPDEEDGHRRIPVILTAREIPEDGGAEAARTLDLREDRLNLVMLHGQQAEHGGSGTIPLNLFRGKGIDYLALGHVHQLEQGRIDGRGIWCCPGCLLGRGFDEQGEHGFVLIDIDTETGKMHRSFIPAPGSRFYEVRADVTGCTDSAEMEERIARRLASGPYREGDFLRVVLAGNLDVEAEKNPVYLRKAFADKYRSFTLRDETKFTVDYAAFRYEPTLRGELVRLLGAEDSLPEERKAEIIRCAMEMLKGET